MGDDPWAIIRRLRYRILDLERENAELRKARDESLDLMLAGVEARDRMMLELICGGALTTPRSEEPR